MGLLSDRQIEKRIEDGELSIENADNFTEQLQPAGVDLCLGSTYREESIQGTAKFGEQITLAPGKMYQLHTVETVSIPDDIKGRLNGKLSISGSGIVINPSGSGLDPGFEGQILLTAYNMSSQPRQIQVGKPVVEIEFESLEQEASSPYGEKSSQYQGREGVE